MKAEIKTAVDGCARFCPEFEITTINLYANNNIYERVYKCEHLEQCEAMIEAMSHATIKAENIT